MKTLIRHACDCARSTYSSALALLPDAAVLVTAALTGWVYTSGVEKVIDVDLFDETSYLARGLALGLVWPAASEGPLYSLWYYLLSLLEPDSLTLYYLSCRALTILLPMLVFVALRAYRVSRVVAYFFLFCWLVTAANFPTHPKVGHLALLVLLTGITTVARTQNNRVRMAALGLASLLASLIRPEFILSTSILGIVLVAQTAKTTWQTRTLKPHSRWSHRSLRSRRLHGRGVSRGGVGIAVL